MMQFNDNLLQNGQKNAVRYALWKQSH